MRNDNANRFVHEPVDLGYTDMIAHTTENGRVYEHPVERKNYPSITTVLSILSEDSIKKWRAKIGEDEANKISVRASRRGTAVHDCLENYVNNVDWKQLISTYTPDIIASVLSVKKTLDERVGKVYGQEIPLYSDHLGVAGRVDCVAEFDGKISIIDYKTSKKWKPRKFVENYFCQETAYAIMWEERTGTPIKQLVVCIAGDEGPQVFIEDRDNWTKDLISTINEYKRRKLFGR